MFEVADSLLASKSMGGLGRSLKDAAQALDTASRLILERANSSPHFLGSVSFNFLMMMGYVCGAWYMGRAALVSSARLDEGCADPDFHRRKIIAATFYMDQVLPRYLACDVAVRSGAALGDVASDEIFG